jgi:DNA-binding NarL/FixJ family response regulator
MSEDAGLSLETTMRALLLAALSDLDLDRQMEILVKAGVGNTEIAKMTGLTAKAVGVRKVRMNQKKKGPK